MSRQEDKLKFNRPICMIQKQARSQRLFVIFGTVINHSSRTEYLFTQEDDNMRQTFKETNVQFKFYKNQEVPEFNYTNNDYSS